MAKAAQVDITKIISDYNTGMPLKSIERIHRVGEKRLRRLLLEAGCDWKNRSVQPRNKPADDVIGERHGNLTITGFVFDDITHHQWMMSIVCDCGNEGIETHNKLKKGKRKTCGVKGCPHFHHVRKTNGRSGKFTGHEEIYGSRWKGWECSALKRNIPFNITPEYAWNLFLNQNRKCALSGVDIDFGTAWNRKITASLDRVDSSEGYVEGNVQWVHKTINVMKRSESDESFIKWCELVIKHKNGMK